MALKILSGPLRLGSGGGLQIKKSGFNANTPTSLSTPVFGWWKPLTQSDLSAVASWADSSGTSNANNALAQATGANQPTFHTNVLNGYGGVTFDGVNDTLVGGAQNYTGYTGYTYFAVVRLEAAGSFPIVLTTHATVEELRYSAATAKPNWTTNSTGTGAVVDGTSRLNSFVILTATASPASGTINNALYVNGAASGTGSHSVTMSNNGTICMGSRSTTLFMQGTVVEAGLYIAGLSTADRHTLEGYLGSKFNISVVQA